jgi:hypothetical protein
MKGISAIYPEDVSIGRAYYFSTQGWVLVLSLVGFSVLLDAAPFAAAAFRALRSKKFDMTGCSSLVTVNGASLLVGSECCIAWFSGPATILVGWVLQAQCRYFTRQAGKRV